MESVSDQDQDGFEEGSNDEKHACLDEESDENERFQHISAALPFKEGKGKAWRVYQIKTKMDSRRAVMMKACMLG